MGGARGGSSGLLITSGQYHQNQKRLPSLSQGKRLSKNNFPSVSRLNKINSLFRTLLKVFKLGTTKVLITVISFSCPILGMKLTLESLFTRVMNGGVTKRLSRGEWCLLKFILVGQ